MLLSQLICTSFIAVSPITVFHTVQTHAVITRPNLQQTQNKPFLLAATTPDFQTFQERAK